MAGSVFQDLMDKAFPALADERKRQEAKKQTPAAPQETTGDVVNRNLEVYRENAGAVANELQLQRERDKMRRGEK